MVSSTSRPHFTPGKDPVHISQEAGWSPGPVLTGGKSRPHRDSIPDRPACSQSLYRLTYRAHRPDIIIPDDDDDNNNNNNNNKGTYILIDVAICGDRNVVKKEAPWPCEMLRYSMLKCARCLAKGSRKTAVSGSAKDLNLRLIGAELP